MTLRVARSRPTSRPATPTTPPRLARLGLECTDPPAAPTDPQQFDEAPDPATAEGKTFEVTVETNCGDITLELDGANAPQTVASFVHLAEEGYFDDTPCHRLVVSGIYVLQCGDPTGQGSGGPGYEFGIENAPADGSYPRGTLAMARTDDPEQQRQPVLHGVRRHDTADRRRWLLCLRHGDQGLPLLEALANNGVDGGGTDGAPKQPISILGMSVTEK